LLPGGVCNPGDDLSFKYQVVDDQGAPSNTAEMTVMIVTDPTDPNLLLGTSGDDYLAGQAGESIYAGAGNDIILFNKDYAHVDGGSGLDFLTGLQPGSTFGAFINSNPNSLDELFTNGSVKNINCIIAGLTSGQLTSLTDLANVGIDIVNDKIAFGTDQFGTSWTNTGNTYSLDSGDYVYMHLSTGGAGDLHVLVHVDTMA